LSSGFSFELIEMLDYPSWRWGLSLIALTMAFHAMAVVMMGIVAVKIRFQLEARGFNLWHLILIMICIVAVIGLLLAVVLVIECGIWAVLQTAPLGIAKSTSSQRRGGALVGGVGPVNADTPASAFLEQVDFFGAATARWGMRVDIVSIAP
jgi:hypothetical protein